MLKIKSVNNPYYYFPDNNKIMCRVVFEELDGEHDFLATHDDPAEHGKNLHFELLAGKYGPIRDYVPPVISKDEITEQVLKQRLNLLAGSDWTQLEDIPSDIKYLWKEYRQALRDITKQTGFPTDISWPKLPSNS